MPRPPRNRWLALRVWLRAVVVAAIALTISESFLLLGIVTPLRVEGSSMAPALLGPHYQVACPHCGWQFAVAADELPTQRRLLCPDCNERFRQAKALSLIPGERLFVNRNRFTLSSPKRWNVVVFRCPAKADTLCIKRVLALPGEHIDFHGGDLFINRNVIRKTLATQQRLRQLVHRERNELRLWNAEDDSWEAAPTGWSHHGQASQLSFSPAGNTPVSDDLGMNQSAIRPSYTVSDLMVSCDAQLQGDASVEMLASFEGGQAVRRSIDGPSNGKLVWSLFDRQALLAVDDTVVWNQPQDTEWPGPPTLAIVARGDVAISNLAVWRDAYYHTRPVDRWPGEGVQLASDQFFVVGDNVAISKDSRTWQARAVEGGLLLGSPLGVE